MGNLTKKLWGPPPSRKKKIEPREGGPLFPRMFKRNNPSSEAIESVDSILDRVQERFERSILPIQYMRKKVEQAVSACFGSNK